jgi:hypothetical protein
MRLPRAFSIVSFTILLAAGGVSAALCQQSAETTAHAISATPDVAVGPQYDTTHVYIAPEDFDRFVSSVLATLGGTTSKKVVTHVTPTPSSTFSQLILTPVGTISAFGFTTPVPYPYGVERTGYLVTDMGTAIRAARQTGADILVTPFDDPIGQDAVIQWPGGVNMQLYSHVTPPSYKPLEQFQKIGFMCPPIGRTRSFKVFWPSRTARFSPMMTTHPVLKLAEQKTPIGEFGSNPPLPS